MIQRMIGAAKLRRETYEEVEADRSATLQALSVVILVALSNGNRQPWFGWPQRTYIVESCFGIVGWAFLAWVTYFVGTTIFTDSSDAGGLGATGTDAGLCPITRSLEGLWSNNSHRSLRVLS